MHATVDWLLEFARDIPWMASGIACMVILAIAGIWAAIERRYGGYNRPRSDKDIASNGK